MKLVYSSSLAHHGIMGQKWGKRNGPPYPLNAEDHSSSEKKARWRKSLSLEESTSQSPKISSDGTMIFQKGFKFNRVGKSSIDINKSGALYVSYGKSDSARYVKALGPTLIGKLLGTAGEAIQHLSAKEEIKTASNNEFVRSISSIVMNDKDLYKSFNESFYSTLLFENPSYYRKEPEKFAYAVSSMLGDGNYAEDSKKIYGYFRELGYDAIPDYRDLLSGTSETAMIIINPDKIKLDSVTMISKDVMKDSKKYVKSIEKLKVSDLIKN